MSSSRSSSPAWRARRLAGLVGAALAMLATPALAREVRVTATDMGRHGRILLEFDRPTKVQARAGNGVLVIGFNPGAEVKRERVAAELPGYVAVVRRDPDRAGLRFAMTGTFRPSLLEAGEKVFIDLLPPDWSGLPPALPPEVVAELARRAEEAEAKVRDRSRQRETEVRKPLPVRVATLPTLTRLTFETPKGVEVAMRREGDEVSLAFDAPLALDLSAARGRLGPARSVTGEGTPDGLLVKVAAEPGLEIRGFREDDAYVLDLERRAAARPAPTPPPPPSAPKTQPAAIPASATPAPVAPAAPVVAAAPPASPVRPELPPGPVKPVAAVTAKGLRVTFPFRARTAAALYERGGLVTAVFHGPDSVEPFQLPPEAQAIAALESSRREGAFTVVRLRLAEDRLARLAPDGGSWVLTLGDEGVAPAEPVGVRRSVDERGRTALTVALPEVSGVYWDEAPGLERVAVATAHGGPRAVVKPQRFAELGLLQTAHGVAVLGLAEDVTVRPSVDGVLVARAGGLAVSLPDPVEAVRGLAGREPAVQREAWMSAQLGDVLRRERDLMDALAAAPRSERGAARLALARFMIANGRDAEAGSVIAHALKEEPALGSRKGVQLLRGVAAARMGRAAEALKLLGGEGLAEDPEAILWRASVEAGRERWAPALVGFRRAAAQLELYPDDLQADLRALSARAAIEEGDLAFAEGELAALDQVKADPKVAERASFLRARLDEAAGKAEAAIEGYKRLAEGASRPVQAQATLRWVNLALAGQGMGADEAVERLETLSVTWRGDRTEVEALGRLGTLHAQAGRWRDAFTVARRANRIFPDDPVTRRLHDDTAKLFEDLFLEGKGGTLSQVEALALYFDFKDFSPIGRRGDEIVRRLADRLVELDLLDPAAELLQHQVDNRLTGAARATVAARLATLRLMAQAPRQALQVLGATRLPDLSEPIRRARLLLEARALSDLSRVDTALEVLSGEEGADAERLRADILWAGRRWREAGEAHEALAGTSWRGPGALTDDGRTDVIRAAIAYGLAEEPLSLDRLRGKFAPKMADSQDARTFALLTAPNASSTKAFRDIARGVTSADTLSAFLAEYRKRYPDAAAAPRPRGQPQASATSAEAPG